MEKKNQRTQPVESRKSRKKHAKIKRRHSFKKQLSIIQTKDSLWKHSSDTYLPNL